MERWWEETRGWEREKGGREKKKGERERGNGDRVGMEMRMGMGMGRRVVELRKLVILRAETEKAEHDVAEAEDKEMSG